MNPQPLGSKRKKALHKTVPDAKSHPALILLLRTVVAPLANLVPFEQSEAPTENTECLSGSKDGMRTKKKRQPGCIFRATRRDPKTGRILYARDYGYKGWPLTPAK